MTPAHGGRQLWWLSPVGAVALVVPATLALAAAMTDTSFRSNYRTPKFLTDGTIALLAAGALVFVLGTLWPLLRRQPDDRGSGLVELRGDQWRRLEQAAAVLFWLTMAGYAAFGISGLRNGVTVTAVLQAVTDQQNYTGTLKTQFATVPGVTSLTQVGIAYVVVAVILLLHRRSGRQGVRLGVVLGLALVRSFLLTERLAILELAVPVIALVAMHLAGSANARARWSAVLAPLVLLPMVIVVFGVFEYSRSWSFFSTRTSQSYLDFTVSRLAGYYVTAYNNGELALHYQPRLTGPPRASVEAFWSAPGVEQLTGVAPASADPVLALANPEFNSPCGLAIPFVDYGTAGGLAFLFAAGSVIGLTYRAFRARRLPAVLIYPVLVTGLFELPRYLYWTQGRVTPAFAGLLATGWWLQRPAPYAARRPRAFPWPLRWRLAVPRSEPLVPRLARVAGQPAIFAAVAAAERRARAIGSSVRGAGASARRTRGRPP